MHRGKASAPSLEGGSIASAHIAEQFCLQDIFPLLVLLRRLVSLIVLPPDRLLALLARNVANDVAAGRHVSLAWLSRVDIDHVVEQVCLTVLSAEILDALWLESQRADRGSPFH